jgi:uncharacterized protein (TIGR00255 family)
MTGMGSGVASAKGATVRVELRSVNHRFLDLALRAPSSLNAYEPLVRERIAAALSRGRVTVNLDMETEAGRVEVVVDDEFVSAYLEAARAMARKHGLGGEIQVAQIAALPEAFRVQERSLPEKTLKSLVQKSLDDALQELDRMRQKEGAALVRELKKRTKAIGTHLSVVRTKAAQQPVDLRRRLEDRLQAAGAREMVDPQRLAQELVMLVEKATITEEIERLGSHLEQFGETLAGDGPGAKRLGFLLQEMHREVNTIGSKSADLGITDRVIRMKEEIENMREQIQNLE